MIELYATDNGLIDSEQMLSERFDETIAPDIIAHYGEDDTVAMNEAFNNWTDTLREDGEIHEEQYNQYCYVGLYS